MRMYFKQRFLSFLDSFDIYDEDGDVLYRVEGQLSWSHCFSVQDAVGKELGTVKQRIFTFLPKFELLENGLPIGVLEKEFTFFQPVYRIDALGWRIEGDFLEWDYEIVDESGRTVAVISKEPLHWTDTYVIEVSDPMDQLYALMFVLAVDAEKCSRSNH